MVRVLTIQGTAPGADRFAVSLADASESGRGTAPVPTQTFPVSPAGERVQPVAGSSPLTERPSPARCPRDPHLAEPSPDTWPPFCGRCGCPLVPELGAHTGEDCRDFARLDVGARARLIAAARTPRPVSPSTTPTPLFPCPTPSQHPN